MIVVSICLSDLPKDKIKVADNGKKYINLILSERKEVGKYGETHTLSLSKTKEEREERVDTVYVGSGKEYKPQNTAVTPESIDDMKGINAEDDDLPF